MPVDPGKLTPEYLSKLSEDEQLELLEELKAELAKVQNKVRGQQRDAVKRLQKSIGRHEAQLAYFTAEARKIDETLVTANATRSDLPEFKKAVRALTLGRTFYRASRKLLAIQMQSLREDLATIATEITGPFEIGDPFVTYDYRRANAEADLAAVQLALIENDRSFRVLAAALGMSTAPEATETPSGGGTAILKKPLASREIKEAGPRTKQFGPSHIGLDDGLPPPADLPETTMVQEPDPEPTPFDDGTPIEGMAPGEVAGDSELSATVPASAPESASALESAPESESPASTSATTSTDAGGREYDENEQFDIDYLMSAFESDDHLKKRAAMLVEQMRDAVALSAKGLEYMGHIATSPPQEGAKLLALDFWSKLNGKSFAMRRLPDQVADSPILTKLFPKRDRPQFPFDRVVPDGATRPIAGMATDRLGLDD
ncbi:MAG: hypothetical protein FJZ00_00125 [Candidatus Sericytochromatia bacterium]|uniref:Uncharacterized protein n=1 Tax=Candidatus Tanganyikabacteria bacterium TaxID=2961651 RepID=A0A937X4N0_9BACT|nr:hypothetical protein [Candidatus Tanganyikabacteria bacterium]